MLHTYLYTLYSVKYNSKSGKRSKKKQKAHLAPVFEDPPEGEEVEEGICDDNDTADYVKNVVKALKLGNGEVLLAVAWVTEESRLYHQMFPRVLGLDVKYGTNNERRPLLRVIGKTGNNRNYTVLNCFMPSEQQYAFAWAISTALPYCLDADALKRTDEDKDQLDTLFLALNVKADSAMGHFIIRLCKWHKVSPL